VDEGSTPGAACGGGAAPTASPLEVLSFKAIQIALLEGPLRDGEAFSVS